MKVFRLLFAIVVPLVGLFFVSMLSTAETAVSAQTEEFHTLKFYLHPDLVVGLTTEERNSRLTRYAEDINSIFAQTNRRFLFDPAADVIITDTQPYQPFGTPPFPTSGYEVWLVATLSDYMAGGRLRSYGGNAGFDGITGSGVAYNLRWDAVHDRSTLVDGSRDLEEYWIQLDHIAHEIAHVFGAGMSEYYSLAQINDMTGMPPIQNVSSFNPNDPYWREHPDYHPDPLLNIIWNRASVGSPTSYADLMNTHHFAEVSVAVINDPCRNGNTSCLFSTIPDLFNSKVRVIDAISGQPISSAQVHVWNIRSVSPYTPKPLANEATDASGEITFLWDTVPQINWFSNYYNMKLVKTFATGYQPAVQYVSIFDAQERKMVHGLDEMVVTLYMWPDTVYAAPDVATCGSWAPCYSGSTSIQDALNNVANNSRVMVLGNHTINTSLQTGNAGTNQAALDGRLGGTITWTGGNGNLFSASTGPLSVVGLNLQCQADCTNSTVFNQSGGQLLAYANNILGFNQGYSGSGTANLRHNWWGSSMDALSIGLNEAYDFRLGASVQSWDTSTLGDAKMRPLNSQGIGVIVSHGRGEAAAPFGNATSEDGNSQCSDYYDYFTVNSSGEWLIQTPIDTTPAACQDIHTNATIYRFAQTGSGAPDTSCLSDTCWQPLPQAVSLNRPNNIRVRLDATQLQGTPIVAANVDGNDPTAVSLNTLNAEANQTTVWFIVSVIGLLFLGLTWGLVQRSKSG